MYMHLKLIMDFLVAFKSGFRNMNVCIKLELLLD